MAATASHEGGTGIKDRVEEAKLAWEEELGWDEQAEQTRESLETDADLSLHQMMRTVQMIGGAVIGIAIIVIVVNAVLTTDVVANTTGPFDGVINSLETTGVAAVSLLVVGLLVAAASQLMAFFGGY